MLLYEGDTGEKEKFYFYAWGIDAFDNLGRMYGK